MADAWCRTWKGKAGHPYGILRQHTFSSGLIFLLLNILLFCNAVVEVGGQGRESNSISGCDFFSKNFPLGHCSAEKLTGCPWGSLGSRLTPFN